MTTRRDILTAAPAVLAIAIVPSVALSANVEEADPIFAAIDRHAAASRAFEAIVRVGGELLDELPSSLRQTDYQWNGEGWVCLRENAGDDPRWVQQELDYMATLDEKLAAEETLADTLPSTHAGIIALCNHAVAYLLDGNGWLNINDWLLGDRETMSSTVTYETFILWNVARALRAMA